jgi:methionine--tRNA ligase beta chain
MNPSQQESLFKFSRKQDVMDEVTFDQWQALKMRVGQIVKVERVPKTDKLYKMQVSVGDPEPIQIVTSLVPFYSEDELMNQKIVVLVNLKPTRFAGELSQGMLLCAEREDESKCVLLTVQKDIEPGTPIT